MDSLGITQGPATTARDACSLKPPPDPPFKTEDPRAVIIPGSVANALIRMESTLSTVGERPCTITLRDGWQIEIALARRNHRTHKSA